MPKKPERFVPRLIIDEGLFRVVRTGPQSLVIEERRDDALGNVAWTTKVPIDMAANPMDRIDGLILRDLYDIFVAFEGLK